jgi:uncharacterized protein YecE (DUF72 family)
MSVSRSGGQDKTIAVGTSGYYFRDWVGPFYPQEIKPAEMLSYYARHFNVLEVNSTYYGIPKPRVFAGMAARVPDHFGFYVKLHQEVTHKREQPEASMKELLQAVEPLKERGMLRGFLAQFPYSFKDTPEARDYLVRLADFWGEREAPLFLEFRHTSWFKPVVFTSLAGHHLGFVNVDLPPLPNLPGPTAEVTNGLGYVRFHGRNASAWWGADGGKRYDYDYNEAELQEWIPRIREIVKKARRTVIFMNNCHMGAAAKNAKLALDLFTRSGE